MKHYSRYALAIGGILASSTGFASFNYMDFSSVVGLDLNGTAHTESNFVRMTDDLVNDQAGNMWATDAQGVGSGFSTSFKFRSDGVGNNHGDGIAFGIQSTGTSYLGGTGESNGVAGGPNGYVVINFQSFWDNVVFMAVDPSGNMLRDQTVAFNGLQRAEGWTADITYDASTFEWNVWLDGNHVMSENLNLGSAVNLMNGNQAYVGVGGGTGSATDNNDVLNWNVDAVPEPMSMTLLGIGALAIARRNRKA